MIKLKVHQLKTAESTLKMLASKQLPAKLAYQVAKIIRAADKELLAIEEARVSAVRKYGKEVQPNSPDEQPSLQVPPESIEAFTVEMQELFDSEIELNAYPIKVGDFGNIELQPIQLLALESLLDEE